MAYCLINFTAPSEEVSNAIIDQLLENKLIACAQKQTVDSHYLWQGKKEHNTEILVSLKTRTKHFDAIEKIIFDLHPYDVPEIIAYDISKGHQSYLQWIEEVTS